MGDYVHVNPAWAGTLRLAIPDGRFDIAPADIGALFAIAGELADIDPCRTGEAYDHDRARERIDAMAAGAEIPRLQVDLKVAALMKRLALRRSAILDSTALRLAGMTNDGARLFDVVEVRDRVFRCTVANTPALLTAHRCYGRLMHGRRGPGVQNRAYVGLSPRAAASFSSATSSVVHARLQTWLLAPGSAGMPESRATVDDATGMVTLRLRHSDLPRYLGLWSTRLRPSAVRVLLERVATDLAGVGFFFHALWSDDGDTCTVRFRRDLESVPEEPAEPDALGIVTATEARTRPAPLKAGERKERDARIAAAHDVPPAPKAEPAPPPARRGRMGASLAEAMPAPVAEPVATPKIPHEYGVELAAALPEPALPATPEPEPAANVATPTVEAAPPAVTVEAVAVEPPAAMPEDADDAPEPPPYARDGWGWRRDREGDGNVGLGSEELARLEDGVIPAFVPRSSVDVINGPTYGDDVRPPWLVRYMRYRISWWLGAWADRPVSAHPPLPRTRIAPFAVWAPGMGAQPAHVFSLADVDTFRDRAMRRAMWAPVREQVDALEERGVNVAEDVPLDLTMREVDYPKLDAEFGREGAEPWDADRVVPHLLPDDRAACDAELARREVRRQAAREASLRRAAARDAARAAEGRAA